MGSIRNICKHCKLDKRMFARGLCQSCYSRHRELYPTLPVGSTKRWAELDFSDDAPLPMEPTQAIPGSEDKIRILELRVEMKTQLFHPQDCLILPSSNKRWSMIESEPNDHAEAEDE